MCAATIIDGKSIAKELRGKIKERVAALAIKPCLAAILVGDDPSSHIYVRNKVKACEEAGLQSVLKLLPADTQPAALSTLIDTLNADKNVHGILLQLPLPAHLTANDFIQRIHPAKDVDGLNYTNIGKLVAGLDTMTPCTPQGVLMLLQKTLGALEGKHAVIIGRSLLFGKPMAQLLLQQNCTVTHCHSKTKDLPTLCRAADILIAATGQPKMVEASWIKPDACVIDVGITRLENGGISGDVDFNAVQAVAKFITPVPGGVGPMTIACLLANTLKAAENC
ncbi:MAG: bifunctional methylenetetrahydrofolate dehydrogenase/methenyltetrahydrofolate cyclohydrolase [Alphaproteobacteria bacterium]|nr:bifunctional methylenetetrahydrofolate dehydrogenase/methenyltetrahydrofolate cyclohydrolase [Alphaproteobacteria bacterium]